ncbi:MAG: response regulator, partial [Deltaproteobacteria bacterium]|nr:response regulator [Deltaproteobacteria bacterium]
MVDQDFTNSGYSLEKKLPAGVLIVDDDPAILQAITRLLRRSSDYNVYTVTKPMEAISILRQKDISVVISDQTMPEMKGVELLSLVRQNWPAVVGIMLTGSSDISLAEDVVNRRLVHYFVTKPWNNDRLRDLIREAVEVNRRQLNQSGEVHQVEGTLLRELRKTAGKAAFSLARAVDARDKYTHSHSENVATFAQIIGRELGLEDNALEELRIGGLLHDVGKIGIPDEVLLKPGRLTDEEFAAIKMHPTIGVSILEPINFPWNIAAIVG